jgi:ribosome-binding factor A
MSKRIQRVNQLIKKELSQILLREIEFPRESLVTVTRVETSPDLKESRIFISVLPEKDESKILEILNRKIYFWQQKLNKRLKMRPIPKIKFFEEKKTAEAARVEEILEELKKEEK